MPALIAGLGLILAGQVTAQTFTTLHNFTGGNDGANPGGGGAGVILSGNTLYGTAGGGGKSGSGTVFGVSTNGTGFTNLYSFTSVTRSNTTNSDGAFPNAGLILSGSTLYGTTIFGGTNSLGTVFAVNTNGTGFTNLHNFSSASAGEAPLAGLTLSGNSLYGAAQAGTVFAINTNGTGFTNLTSGNGLVSDPTYALTLSGNTLYGTTMTGGFQNQGYGSVFAINTNGTGFTNLYSFGGGYTGPGDGAYPNGGIIISGNTLYGTTMIGGNGFNGTVFALNTDGTGFSNTRLSMLT